MSIATESIIAAVLVVIAGLIILKTERDMRRLRARDALLRDMKLRQLHERAAVAETIEEIVGIENEAIRQATVAPSLDHPTLVTYGAVRLMCLRRAREITAQEIDALAEQR